VADPYGTQIYLWILGGAGGAALATLGGAFLGVAVHGRRLQGGSDLQKLLQAQAEVRTRRGKVMVYRTMNYIVLLGKCISLHMMALPSTQHVLG